MSNSAHVYFIRPIGHDDGPVKIGYSRATRNRLAALATWSPYPLEIVATTPGGRALEKNLHECFADDFLHKEWFRFSERLRACIEGLRAGHPIEAVIDLSDRKPVPQYRHFQSPESRLRATYSHRLSWAERRFQTSETWASLPDAARDIMRRWRGVGDGQAVDPISPSDAEIAFLDAVIADPGKYVSIWRRRVAA